MHRTLSVTSLISSSYPWLQNRLPQGGKDDNRSGGDTSHDQEKGRLVKVLQEKGSDQISKDLRGHVVGPEVAEVEALGLLSGAVGNVLALSHPLHRVTEAVEHRGEQLGEVDEAVGVDEERRAWVLGLEGRRQGAQNPHGVAEAAQHQALFDSNLSHNGSCD